MRSLGSACKGIFYRAVGECCKFIHRLIFLHSPSAFLGNVYLRCTCLPVQSVSHCLCPAPCQIYQLGCKRQNDNGGPMVGFQMSWSFNVTSCTVSIKMPIFSKCKCVLMFCRNIPLVIVIKCKRLAKFDS